MRLDGCGDSVFTYGGSANRTASTDALGRTTTYTYDNLSRLLSVLHQIGGNTIDGATYTVDGVGNRTSKTNHLNSETSNFTYDQIYKLTQVLIGGNTTESYTYDQVGNRQSSIDLSPYVYNSSNQLTSTPISSFTYDENGNTLTKTDAVGSTNHVWNFDNRLSGITLPDQTSVLFKYDPFGRRIQKISPQAITIYVYDGSSIIQEVDTNGAPLARYTHASGVDEPLAMVRNGSTYFYHADGLGSITSITDSIGLTAATYSYDSFGNLTASTGTLINPFRYTARELDADVNLYFFRARYYDAHSGRFLSEDPLRILTGVNFFEYVLNNPTNLVDPHGLVGLRFKGSWQRRQMGFLDRLTSYEGAFNWGADIVSQCVCTGEGWQLQLKITVYMKIWYVDDLALAHETKHARILKNMWGDTVREYEKFEQTYPSQLMCEHYRRVLIDNDYRRGAINDKFNYDYNRIDKAVGEPDQLWNRIKEWFGWQ